MRVAAKKLRYLTDYFGAIFDVDDAREYAESLARVQEILGALNDAAVAKTLLGQIDAPATARGIVLGWQEGRVVCDLEKLGDAWNAFRELKPYWR